MTFSLATDDPAPAALASPNAPMPAMSVRRAHALITVDCERLDDVDARERLLDRAFGPSRFRKTSQKLRLGRRAASGLSLVARCGGDVVGTVRLWHVTAGGVAALMLGPLAVSDGLRQHGIGTLLMVEALDRAKALGHAAVLLVGDAPYYGRFGFTRHLTRDLRLPGPVDDERFLGLELQPGSLQGAKGSVRPTGAIDIAARPGPSGSRTRGRRIA